MVSTRFARLVEPAMAAPIRACIHVVRQIVDARALEMARAARTRLMPPEETHAHPNPSPVRARGSAA